MTSLIIFLPAIDPGPGGAEETGISIFYFLLLVNILINLPIDLLSSIGIFRIARINRLRSAWLAWIPLVNLWTLGCIADHYWKGKGKKSCLRWGLVVYILLIVWMILGMWGPEPISMYICAITNSVMWAFELMGVVGIAAVYCSLYGLYKSVGWVRNSEAYVILGVLFSIPTPFCILYSSKYY